VARRKSGAAVELAQRQELTAGLIEALRCPDGKAQAFLRDSKVPGLRVRVTSAGAKSFVFEAKLRGQTLRRTIGNVAAWSIEAARREAKQLTVDVDNGIDPREVEREEAERKLLERAAAEARHAEDATRATTVLQAWTRYLAEGKPRGKAAWKPRYRADLMLAAAAGGEKLKRGNGTTKPGHLWPLMGRRLVDIDADLIRDWYVVEKKRAPVQAARAAAMFSGFLRWCSMRKEFRGLVQRDAARAGELADLLPEKKRREDALEIEQLKPWFAGTDKLRSGTARAYLQALVLTGARREEMAGLRWEEVDFRWRRLTLADKVGDRRVIPLTPYLASVLAALPRETFADGEPNPYVFASPSSKLGRIAEPRAPHADVLADGAIPHVSIHGLRRTFALLGEAAGAPAGAIAQVMGHRPSAVHEGYKPRSVDALRPYLALVERFVLACAGIEFEDVHLAGGLRLVASA